ncbi:MAG TPA: CGNR zinc finger domain-containing protein [Candidatus Sulfotelmatobacter sp.]|nr:CGNR zinc finger domain-containing protein [Candidatus Sulfotelmatobacter sp.]
MPRPLPNQWGVAPCLDLINTRWSDHVGSGVFHDRLPLSQWRRAFLRQWGYRVADPDDASARSQMVRLRGLLRATLESYMSTGRLSPGLRRRLEKEVNRAPFVLRIAGAGGMDGLVLERAGAAWDVVLADVATSAARLIGERRVVKVCANPSCTWMFVDESRSGSRRWCDVSICGSLINVRRHRGLAPEPADSRRPGPRPGGATHKSRSTPRR